MKSRSEEENWVENIYSLCPPLNLSAINTNKIIKKVNKEKENGKNKFK